MKIAIIGAGAMGSLYGAQLSKVADNEVWLLDVWRDHVDSINKNGLILEESGRDVVYKNVHASSDPNDCGVADLAVVFVKSILTKQAVETNRVVFGPDTTVLTLQNGLGNIDTIASVIGEKNVIAGTTAHGATVLGPGHIRFASHAGGGATVIGELDGKPSSRLDRVKKNFESAGFEMKISDNVLGLVWDKLLVNVGINALTAILRVRNGELLEHAELEELLEQVVAEGAAVAHAMGIKLINEDAVAHAKEVARLTGPNKSSMHQDILAHRRTEIDMINGAIVREGKAHGVPTPVNGVVTDLIKFIESYEPKE